MVPRQEALGEPAHVGEVGEVADLGGQPAAGIREPGSNPGDRSGDPVLVSPEQVHVCAGREQAFAGGLSDSGVATGDQDRLTLKIRRDRVLPVQAAQPIAESRVSGEHGGVERSIKCSCAHRAVAPCRSETCIEAAGSP